MGGVGGVVVGWRAVELSPGFTMKTLFRHEEVAVFWLQNNKKYVMEILQPSSSSSHLHPAAAAAAVTFAAQS